MKPLYFLLLLSSACGGQSNIEGIGPFRVGKTRPTILYNLLSESSDSLHKITSINQVQFGSLTVYELLNDKDSPADPAPYSTYCPAGKVLLLNNYSIDNIPLTNVILCFYDNVLVSFQCDHSAALAQALLKKYGQPAVSNQHKQSACAGQMDSVRTTWWINGLLTATATCRVDYDRTSSKRTTGQL